MNNENKIEDKDNAKPLEKMFGRELDLSEIDLIEKFQMMLNDIRHTDEIIRRKFNDRISWCQKNRAEIKKLFPTKGRIYQIANHKKTVHYDSDKLIDDVYFFRPINTQFIPLNDFYFPNMSTKFPTVSGELLDCNLRKISDSNVRVCITGLIEIEKDKSPEKLANRFTKVYIMIDKSTGYYKIGRSNNPTYREKTLQSEKPTVELLHTFDARIKDEKKIHVMFSSKRVRGEWFDLSGSDIAKILDYFGVEKTYV